ncbi:MAG: flagellar basal body-associated FliL family protein [Acidobacteriota bacterium]|jgi:flagellar FliL protein|nr:flagellar basal body-associated FliL family protein [Acidobacteriota bacterium]
MAATDNPGTEIGLTDIQKKKPNILLIAVGILIFLLVVAVGGFVGYTQLPKAVGEPAVVEQKVVRLEVNDVITLAPFLVNLADADDIRFLKAEFRLGMLEKPKVPLEADSKEIAAVRDAIISLLSSKTAEQVITAEGKEALREEIRVLVNERLPKNRVSEVYIVDFVVQL